jgi:hypothetical protein
MAPLGVAADPFAAGPVPSTLPMSQQPGPATRQAMDQGFGAAPDMEMGPVPGLPSAKPQWLLPLIVGVLALVLGGAVTLVVMMH